MIKNVLFVSFTFICLLIFIGSYHHRYEKRLETYYKHIHVIEEACVPYKIDSSIQLNTVTYDGLVTNCSISRQYANINLYLGTFYDMWIESPFYKILWLENPWAFWIFVGAIIFLPLYYVKSRLDGENQAKLIERVFHIPPTQHRLKYDNDNTYSVSKILKEQPNLIDLHTPILMSSHSVKLPNLLNELSSFTSLNTMD
jgi:hypothetical protein